jgi:hypothetical protein
MSIQADDLPDRKEWASLCMLDNGTLSSYSKRELSAFVERCFSLDADEKRDFAKMSAKEVRERLRESLPKEVFSSLRDAKRTARIGAARASLRSRLHALHTRNTCTAFVADALPDASVLRRPTATEADSYYANRLLSLLRSQRPPDETHRGAMMLGALITFVQGDTSRVPRKYQKWLRTAMEKITGLQGSAATPDAVMTALNRGPCRRRRGVAFLDDKEDNLREVGASCACVFPILCQRGYPVRSVEQWQEFVAALGAQGEQAAAAMLKWLGAHPEALKRRYRGSGGAARFDPRAILDGGIDMDMARRLTTALSANELRGVVLDWDRTVTRHTGKLPLSPDSEARDLAAVVRSLNHVDGGRDEPVTPEGVVAYYIGGEERVEMMRTLARAAQRVEAPRREILILTRSSETAFIDGVMRHLQQAPEYSFAVRSVAGDEEDEDDVEEAKLDVLRGQSSLCGEDADRFPCFFPESIQPLVYGDWKSIPRV